MSDSAAGQWLPYETEDGNLHDCRVKKDTKRKVEQTKPLTIEDLDLRLRMVESIVIGAKK